MAGIRCPALQSRPMALLDCTSLPLDALPPLGPPCEPACHARMAVWRMAGTSRTARRFPVDHNCPLPPPDERLFFLLVSRHTSALQVVHGRLCGLVQGTAKQGMHVLWPGLLAALRGSGAGAPGRSASRRARLPPCAHDGPPRRSVRPQDPGAQPDGESGKTKAHPGKNVLLGHA